MKKGQGLSLNTIIIAAIVLVVLIVLWAIFTGRMAKFTGELQKEESKNCKTLMSERGGGAGPQEPPCKNEEVGVKTPDLAGTQVCCVNK